MGVFLFNELFFDLGEGGRLGGALLSEALTGVSTRPSEHCFSTRLVYDVACLPCRRSRKMRRTALSGAVVAHCPAALVGAPVRVALAVQATMWAKWEGRESLSRWRCMLC